MSQITTIKATTAQTIQVGIVFDYNVNGSSKIMTTKLYAGDPATSQPVAQTESTLKLSQLSSINLSASGVSVVGGLYTDDLDTFVDFDGTFSSPFLSGKTRP